MSFKIISALGLLAGVMTVSGCAVPTQEEGVGTTEQAVGEFSCSFNTPALGEGARMEAHWCFSPNIMTTPDTSYDSSYCPAQWIGEFTNTAGHGFTPQIYFNSVPTTQSGCEANHGALTVYTYNSLTHSWTMMPTTYVEGIWFFGSCILSPSPGYSWQSVSSSPYTTKIRAVGQLIIGSGLTSHKARFQVGWTSGC